MNSSEAIERAMRLIKPDPTREEQLHWRTALGVLINDARTELARQVAASGDQHHRSLLRKTFPDVTSDVNGLADLTALVTADEPLMLTSLMSAEIYLDGVARRLTLLPDETAVKRDRTPGFPFGTLIGSSLLVYNGGAPFAGDVSIGGPFIPKVETLTKELQEPFVLVLASLGKSDIPSRVRTTTQEMRATAKEA